MRWCKIVLATICLSAVTAAFFDFPFVSAATWIQAVPSALNHPLVALPILVIGTLLLGRFYCDVICPLGVLQSLVNWLFHPKTHVRRVCTRLPKSRAQHCVNWVVVVLFLMLPFGLFDPYAIYGRMLVWPWTLGIVGVLVLVSALFAKGRLWCNWVCPLGTVFALLSRFSLFRNRVDSTCGNCRKCFGHSEDERKNSDEGVGVERRAAIKGIAALAVTDKIVDGGLAEVSMPGIPDRQVSVLPPGAGNSRDYGRKCVSCQLCVSRCPEKVLKPSTRLTTFGQPELDFRNGYCRIACTKCGVVCPSGAIVKLQAEQRPHVHMGRAVWKRELCVRTTNGDQCTACVRKCPLQAIKLVKGFPVVDEATCIGCGACEHVCPSRPMPAIFVKGYEVQRMIKPIAEADLVAEMKTLIANGTSVVLARHGVIVSQEKGSGIAPIVHLLDEGKLNGVIAVDKVVGRAAAAIFIAGGVRKVFSSVMSLGAKQLLSAHGIESGADQEVEAIINRQKDGICPMEKAVNGMEDIDEMVKALRKAMKK